jgi:hypothetical protein
MQHEITSSSPLLDENGNIAEPGYAKKLLPVYRRADIKAPAVRIKEWDYYLINNGRFALALTVDDNGYMSLDSISLLNFDEKWEITASPMGFMPLGRVGLPETSAVGDTRHAGPRCTGLGIYVMSVSRTVRGPNDLNCLFSMFGAVLFSCRRLPSLRYGFTFRTGHTR